MYATCKVLSGSRPQHIIIIEFRFNNVGNICFIFIGRSFMTDAVEDMVDFIETNLTRGRLYTVSCGNAYTFTC